jgi:hypothetical protein
MDQQVMHYFNLFARYVERLLRGVVPPTQDEIAKMSTQEKYDLFGTRYVTKHPK